MSFFNKHVVKNVAKGFHSVGFGKDSSRRLSKWITNPARAAQRSHILGKLGHTLLPSSSSNNLVTRGYMSLMKGLAKSANRLASRMASSPVVQSASTASKLPALQTQRLDYRYRRLKDLT